MMIPKKRLLAVLFAAVLMAGGFLAYSIIQNKEGASSVDRQAEVLRLSRLAASNAEQLIADIKPLLYALSQLPDVHEKNAAACDRTFAEILKQNPRLANIGVASVPDGDLFCSGLPFERPLGALDRSWYQKSLEAKDFAAGNYQIGRITKKATINFGYPVLDSSGQIHAIVFAAFDLRWLEHFAASADLPDGSVITVVDREGTILSRYPDEGGFEGQVAPEAPLIRGVLAKREGAMYVEGLDNIERYYGFTSLPSTSDDGVYVIIGIPK